MYEVSTAIVGTVVTQPMRRQLPSGEEVVSFRMASNPRRFDANTGQWVDGDSMYLTVSCWRRLVAGVNESLHRGDPIIAYGTLSSHEYRTRSGMERSDVEMRATALGPDLGRCTAPVLRKRFGRADSDQSASYRAAEHTGGTEKSFGVASETTHVEAAEPPIPVGDNIGDLRAG
ncbi:single-stranded DNA-binding protein [Nocardia sp. NPDC050406]|uniref:single-stranded DNA-binding protein n=1 Tax=Nocardia sp. NPDC050406 TaxID=3364318 RepID=UPI0037A7E31F